MKIIRATHMGMCFGVRDAIQLAEAEARRGPLTVFGDLVHNPTVMNDLARHGVVVQRLPEQLRTESVMITAHGASDRRIGEIRARGHRIVEATCPLVRHAHRTLAKLVAKGLHPVVVGQSGHVEVLGLVGDFPGAEVILSHQDVDELQEREGFGVISQTTQPRERVQSLMERLRGRFPGVPVEWVDTVCQPTRQRQEAAQELARLCTVVIVVGGPQSNNTRELGLTCGRHGARVHRIASAEELRPDWFEPEDVVGLTAGTSTPERDIDRVIERLENLSVEFSVPVTA